MISLLQERFPELWLLLFSAPVEPLEHALHAENIAEEVQVWRKKLPDLEQIDTLYVYGVGLGHYYPSLKNWLHASPQRRVVFLEDDLRVFTPFLEQKRSQEILEDTQVLIRFIQDIDLLVEDLAQTLPSERVEVTALELYAQRRKRRFASLKMKLMRNSSAVHALLAESLFAHKIFSNLAPNIQKLGTSFYANGLRDRFKNVPAILCGAGPSLKSAIPMLQKLENRALIIAGGSAITALSTQGVTPHFCMAFDPNREEYFRLRASSAFEVPFLYGNRLLPSIFNLANGPWGYLKSDTGGMFENWIEQQIGLEGEAIGPALGREAFSVTTLALAAAYTFGCNPIILAGVDLAYTGGQRYAEGVVAAPPGISDYTIEKRIYRKDRQGKRIATLLKWIMEADTIARFAKKHPDRLFLSATEGGIGIRGIPFQPLEEVVLRHCTTAHDLRGKIHAEIQALRMGGGAAEKIRASYKEIEESLQRARALCQAILKEKERAPLFQMDLEEEPAYTPLLCNPLHAIDRLLHRSFEQDPDAAHRMKWERLQEIIDSYLGSINL